MSDKDEMQIIKEGRCSNMAEYEVEYASFTKVKFKAESQEEAEMIASIMEGEEIEEKGRCEGYVIWNEPVQIN